MAKKKKKTPKGYSGRIYKKDYGKVKPTKIVPGVQGRAEWFAERAGCRPNSLSIERLKSALDLGKGLQIDETARRDLELEEVYTLLRKAKIKKGRIDTAILVNPSGKKNKLSYEKQREESGYSSVCDPVVVPQLREGWGLIVIPVEQQTLRYLDLDEVAGAEVSDLQESKIVDSFYYLPEYDLIAGRITKAGIYQPFALPKHPWLRQAVFTICHYWRWIIADPIIRDHSPSSPGIIDRICHLILCPPDYFQIQDPRVFGEFGLGYPPGYQGGEFDLPPDYMIPPELGHEDICAHCLRSYFGEIIREGVVIFPPPIIRLCWRRFRKCSKWISIGPNPDATFNGIGRVTQLDIHPSNGNILIAAAAGGGVWRSTNAGASWRPLMQTEPTLTMGAVAIAPSFPTILYAASGEDADGFNPAWSGVGVYRSTDNGQHWQLMTGVASTTFSAIVVHPSNANTIYVAGNRGLHKSTDGGITWITNPGLASLFDGQITDIVIAHDDPQRVYIGVWNNGVHMSTTGGEDTGSPAFTRLDGANQLPSGTAAGWIKLSIGRNGADGSDFIAAKMGNSGSRIFRTTNAGTTWTELANNVASVGFDEWCSVIAVDPNDQDILYAGASTALQRTTNGGQNSGDWTSINIGVHPDQQDIVFDPNDSTRLFLANDGGIYRTENRGDTWTFESSRLAITQFYDMDICQIDKDVVAGGAQDNGIYYRNTSGIWSNIPWGDGTQVAIDPTDPDIFYFSSQNGLPANLRRSTDGGASHFQVGQPGLSGGSPWITIIKVDPRNPITDPANNRIVFVCGTNNLFRSTNGGASWQRVEDGSGNPFIPAGQITALEFAPNNFNVVYLGTSSGALYRTVSGGATSADWNRIDTIGSSADALFPNSRIQAIRVNPKNQNDVWVVFGGAGVTFTGRPDMILNPLGISHLFRSPDGGTNWMDVSGQFPNLSLPDVPTNALALSDVDYDIAYVGTDVGVFKTTNGGQTWQGFQDGLPRSPIVELLYHYSYDRLFAATMGRGVYIRDV